MGLQSTDQAATDTSASVVPLAAAQTAGLTFPQKQRFRFNKDDTGFQRAAVEVEIPVPSYQGLVQILSNAETVDGKKAFELLQQAAAQVVIGEVRSYVSDNPNASQETIPWDKFTFDAISKVPQGIRGVSSIAKELWEKFAKAYVAVMPALSQSTPEMCAARVSVLVQKFRPLTGNPDRKKIIENLMATIAIFVGSNTPDLEEYTPILEFLTKKADELKAEDSVITSDALGF
jgi:hypothetical protein